MKSLPALAVHPPLFDMVIVSQMVDHVNVDITGRLLYNGYINLRSNDMTTFNYNGTINKRDLTGWNKFPLDEYGNDVQVPFFVKCAAIHFCDENVH